MSTEPRTRVVIAGGGVAALEAALALKESADDLVQISMIAPGATFTYRPELVGEPFSFRAARRYPLAAIASELGIRLHVDSLKWVDHNERVAHTADGEKIGYDALLLAVGAQASAVLDHALTLNPELLDEQLHGMVQDLEGGWVKRVAFVIPERASWPLPMYELALMAARTANEMNEKPAITLVTPEDAPLAVFGDQAVQTIQALLEEHAVEVVTSAHCTMPRAGHLIVHPGEREIRAELVITLPELSGPAIPGIPLSAAHGFITTDRESRVAGVDRVFAAGDLTDFPVKQGGIAAQQADSAAAAIAALAGAAVDPRPLVPELCGLLWDGDRTLYLRTQMTGSHGSRSEVSSEPLWSPPDKIQARLLGPYLSSLDRS